MKRLILRFWNSPTFTTWANISTKSLRFVLVTPLILTRFDTTELAAWYLFSSLTFFGTIIHTRITTVFNRMVAFAMAGARDLSAMGSVKQARGDGKPDWPTVRRTYGAVGFLTLITASLAAISGLALGYFSLTGILEGYGDPDKIWLALLIMMGGQTLSMCFSQYMVTVRGMGLIALTNRWSCLFSILSVLVGLTVLSLGYGIVVLAAAMQATSLLNILRMKLLVNYVHGGKLRSAPSVAFDREVIRWAWPAFWRGLFTTIANRGVIQVGAVVYARYAPVEAVASYLFSFNMLKTVAGFSEAPLNSHNPMLSRALAKGEKQRLRRLFFKKATQSQILLSLSALALGILLPVALSYIDSNAEFLEPLHWALFSSAFLLQRYFLLGLRPLALGNIVPFVKANSLAAILSLGGMVPLVMHWGFYGLVVGLYLPQFLLLHIRPAFLSARMLELSPYAFLSRSCGWAVVAYLLAQILYVAFAEPLQALLTAWPL